MTNAELIERIMDWLTGELSPQEGLELKEILAADPEMDRQALELQRVSDKLEEAEPEAAQQDSVLQRVYQRIAAGQDQLSDEDLDQAAGGIWHHVPPWLKKDSNHDN